MSVSLHKFPIVSIPRNKYDLLEKMIFFGPAMFHYQAAQNMTGETLFHIFSFYNVSEDVKIMQVEIDVEDEETHSRWLQAYITTPQYENFLQKKGYLNDYLRDSLGQKVFLIDHYSNPDLAPEQKMVARAIAFYLLPFDYVPYDIPLLKFIASKMDKEICQSIVEHAPKATVNEQPPATYRGSTFSLNRLLGERKSSSSQIT